MNIKGPFTDQIVFCPDLKIDSHKAFYGNEYYFVMDGLYLVRAYGYWHQIFAKAGDKLQGVSFSVRIS